MPLILGLRDVMDEPDLLAPEWERKNVVPALRDLYDDIWVYGLPQICDPLEGIELPKSVRKTHDLHRLSARAPCRMPPLPPTPLKKISGPYLLVTTGGGGDGEGVIDWVLRAYEHDKAMPLPALLVLGPFMQSERQAEFLDRAARLKKVEAITFDAQLETLMERAVGRRRHGRLQHLLRDPVLRQAGPDRAAHRAAHGAVYPRRPRPRSSASAACWSEDDVKDPKAMATALRHLPQQRLPSQVVVPGLLDGQLQCRASRRQMARPRPPAAAHRGPPPRPPLIPRVMPCRCRHSRESGNPGPQISRLPWIPAFAGMTAGGGDSDPTAVRPGYDSAVTTAGPSSSGDPGEIVVPAEGLSAAVRDLHRPGDPRAGGGAASRSGSCRCAIRPTARPIPSTAEIRAPVLYLPEYLYARAAARCWRGWWRARRLPGYRRRVPGLAGRSPPRPDAQPRPALRPGAGAGGRAAGRASRRLHAHFLHTPASVARYAALMTGNCPGASRPMPRTSGRRPIGRSAEKLAACDWLVTCTAVGADPSGALAPAPAQVTLVHHGLDLARFPAPTAPAPAPRRRAIRRDPVDHPLGRARGGQEGLSTTCWRRWRLLPADLAWRLVHIGGGPLLPGLKRQAESARPCRPHRLARRRRRRTRSWRPCARADLFALASRIARDGDRDGLPNVLMEAASQGLASVATRAGAIEELVIDGETGLLVPPGDPAALAAAMGRLIADPALRARLGAAGQARCAAISASPPGIAQLAARAPASPRGRPACA